MSMKISRVMIGAVSLAAVFGARAYAQAPAGDPADRRPFRGIFGAPASPDAPHSLVLSGTLFGAYDESSIDGLVNPQTGLPWLQRTGAYYGADAGLNYVVRAQGTRFGVQGQTGARVNYYNQDGRSRVLPTYRGDVTITARLTHTLSLGLHQSAAYLSHYNNSLTPRLGDGLGHDIGIPDDPAQDIFELKAVRTASTVTLMNRFGRYLFASGAYHYRSQQVLDDDDSTTSRFYDYGTHAGSATIMYARPVTRHATLQLGYQGKASDSRSRTGEPQFLHTINAGVNYGRALSFSRRTSLNFSTGSAIAAQERDAVPNGTARSQIRLTGNAALVHQMGQTWTAQLAYTRGFRTHDGFDDLFFTDALNASLGGFITRRLSFDAVAAVAGSSLETRGGRHRGRSATARAQFALTSFTALYAQYIYHYYRFSDDVQIDGRLPRRLDRQGVRVGVSASVPLIR